MDLLRTAIELVGVRPRRAQHRAPARKGAAQLLDTERDEPALQHALPPIEEPDELVAVHALALASDGAHHGVQSGAVAAAGEHGHSHALSS